MAHPEFSDLTVLILAHGSTVNDGSAAAPVGLARCLQATGSFAGVLPCFWKQQPRLQSVLEDVSSRRIVVVPFFAGAGWFVDEQIPAALGLGPRGHDNTGHRSMTSDGRTLYYTPPVGSHPCVTEALLHRASEVTRDHPFPRRPAPATTTLVVAGHGTTLSPRSRLAVETQVERIRSRRLYRDVLPAFMEEEPRIEGCIGRATSPHVIVVPFFMSDGLHVVEDIPVLLGESREAVAGRLRAGRPTWRNPTGRNGRLVWYAPGVGTSPLMAEAVMDLVRQAVGTSAHAPAV